MIAVGRATGADAGAGWGCGVRVQVGGRSGGCVREMGATSEMFVGNIVLVTIYTGDISSSGNPVTPAGCTLNTPVLPPPSYFRAIFLF